LQLKLTRITDGKKIIPEIEGLRFVSIVLVIFSHIHNNILRIYQEQQHSLPQTRFAIFLEECGAGVNIFFFISGFILAIPFLQAYVYQERKISLKHYYYRRLTRIEPPYLITLVLFLVATVFLLNQPFSDSIKHFVASAVYLHSIIYDRISTINPVAWTLEIEVQYYIIAPLIAIALFFKNPLLRRLSLFALFIGSMFLYYRNFTFFESYHLTKSIFAYLSIFVMGILVADWYLTYKQFFTGKRYVLLDLAGLAALILIITLSGYADMSYRLLLFGCYCILFISIFRGSLLNRLLTKRWTMIIGGMCYSIYLMHYAVIYLITQSFSKGILTFNYARDIIIQSLILLPAILIASGFFFVLFERPFMNIQWPQQLRHFAQKRYPGIFGQKKKARKQV